MQETPKKPNEVSTLPETLNFQSHELPSQNTCNSHVDQNTPYFPSNQIFEMKEASRLNEVDVQLDSARKLASEILQNSNQHATGVPKIKFPIKFGENSRKRQRTNDGVKSALQRKMDHLDKEKERR